MSSRIIFNTKIITALLVTFLFALFPITASAKVTGPCADCHTMHNSQNGLAVDSAGPNDNLLKGFNQQNTCAGCHSASSGADWTEPSTGAPIVWNRDAAPTYGYGGDAGLAGGNFYWVAQGDNSKGHNVFGVAQNADTLTTAPGRNILGCINSCHDTLFDGPNTDNKNRGGCQGCHVFVSHHDDSNNWYRSLKGHGQPPFGTGAGDGKDDGDYVTGVGDSDWEKTVDASDHNFYKGTTIPISGEYTEGNALESFNTITAFCQGCHGVFHGKVDAPSAGDGMGSASPWIRHPTDIKLPDDAGKEYIGYDPTSAYSPEAPVAWVNPGTIDRAQAVVMCLSCHRPHGSKYSDMLRWDYNTMVVGTSGAAAGTGCFTCHTAKDG